MAAKKLQGTLPSHARFPRAHDQGIRGREASDESWGETDKQSHDRPCACLAGRCQQERNIHRVPPAGSDGGRNLRQYLCFQLCGPRCDGQLFSSGYITNGDPARCPGLDCGRDQYRPRWYRFRRILLRSNLPTAQALLGSDGMSPPHDWRRCLTWSFQFETVRLYTAVAIAKSTGSSPQPLKIGKNTVIIPKNTTVIPNYSALHTHPRYWGKNSLEFEPSRWITSDSQPNGDAYHPNAALHAETFKEPPKSNSPFVGWSGGARNCPGRKFSQVEFVGVLVGVFRNFKVNPVPQAGEDDAMARARLLGQIQKDTGMELLLQMLHPEKAVLQWTRR